MSVDDLTPQEIAAALAARRELGPDYEKEIAASIADRMERRIEAEIRARTPQAPEPERVADVEAAKGQAALGIVSIVCGTVITVSTTGPGNQAGGVIFASWVGIALVNAAFGLSRRRRRKG